MTNRICQIISNELRYDVEMRIAATLHRAGITSDQWNDLGDNPKTRKTPWTLLPEPARCAIMNHLVSMEKTIAIIGWAGRVNLDDIPDIPELKSRLADFAADRLEV